MLEGARVTAVNGLTEGVGIMRAPVSKEATCNLFGMYTRIVRGRRASAPPKLPGPRRRGLRGLFGAFLGRLRLGFQVCGFGFRYAVCVCVCARACVCICVCLFVFFGLGSGWLPSVSTLKRLYTMATSLRVTQAFFVNKNPVWVSADCRVCQQSKI